MPDFNDFHAYKSMSSGSGSGKGGGDGLGWLPKLLIDLAVICIIILIGKS